jgi:uncharacterized protein YcgI (DUF1989 family)
MEQNEILTAVSERTIVERHLVPPKSGVAAVVRRGQHVRVTDVEGKQAGDFAAFNLDNVRERLCVNLSRSRQFKPGESYRIKDRFEVGDVLYSSAYRPLLRIVADTPVPGGRHETELHSCNREMFERMGRPVPPNGGCWEILSSALESYGVLPEDIPDTFDCFGNLEHHPEDGEWRWHEPVSRPGDYIEFRAEMDVVVGLSVCPWETDTPVNGWVITPLMVEVFDVEYWQH